MNGARKNWSREETILAFDLYCRTPFSKVVKTNPEIIKLARIIGRSPSAVSLKISNLAHYDPELRKNGIVGMSHASKQDELIFNEFCDNGERLSVIAQSILADYQNISIQEELSNLEIDERLLGEDVPTDSKSRLGQWYFRLWVLNSYRNSCCITGLRNDELLIASHIKPWRVSAIEGERTNPCNGLCLNALHDKAFDRGYITVDSSYKIVVSNRMRDVPMDSDTKEWFMSYEGKQISLPEKFYPRKDFIEYHNDVIFKR